MNILLLGSGGREHAFAWKISQSPKCDQLYVAPGNAGTAEIAKNVSLKINDFESICSFIQESEIELVVVGPEEPLVKGITDFVQNHPEVSHIPVIGPSQIGATLEGSKDFSKRFMQRNNIPTAAYETFSSNELDEGIAYLEKQSMPIVLKADGLAAGKGVLICETLEDAKKNLKEMLVEAKFGSASSKVVIEEFLTGIELSVFVATDGKNYKILPEAKDYKRIGEGDTGLNTGGMGAVSPVIFADDKFMQKVEERIIKPTVDGLAKEGIPYKGFIFIGLMNQNDEPYVIEYNVRMGDPETQAVLSRIDSDFLEMLEAMGSESLENYNLSISPSFATTVVMVSGGYPGSYQKGFPIYLRPMEKGAILFHAGTSRNEANELINTGGRVLAITGLGKTLEEALKTTFEGVSKVSWEKAFYRKDIGQDILKLYN